MSLRCMPGLSWGWSLLGVLDPTDPQLRRDLCQIEAWGWKYRNSVSLNLKRDLSEECGVAQSLRGKAEPGFGKTGVRWVWGPRQQELTGRGSAMSCDHFLYTSLLSKIQSFST